jgi:hypothetical protein
MKWLLIYAMLAGNGDLYIYETENCAYLVEYQNKLGVGVEQDVHLNDEIHIWVESNVHGLDEIVYAERYGYTQQMIVTDHETGRICVPYFMGA